MCVVCVCVSLCVCVCVCVCLFWLSVSVSVYARVIIYRHDIHVYESVIVHFKLIQILLVL